MIGQINNINKILKYSLDTLPRSIGIVGDKFSGRKSLSKIISDNFNLEYINYSKDIELPENKLCLVVIDFDGEENLVLSQSKLLKTIEEPQDNLWFVLIMSDTSIILPAILNRLFIIEMEEYNNYDLTCFCEKNNIDMSLVGLFNTPGLLLESSKLNITEMYHTCDTLITRVGEANYSNVLSIANKISGESIPLPIFFKVILKAILSHLGDENSNLYMNYYDITNEAINKLKMPVIQNHLVYNYLTNLWLASRGL